MQISLNSIISTSGMWLKQTAQSNILLLYINHRPWFWSAAFIDWWKILDVNFFLE